MRKNYKTLFINLLDCFGALEILIKGVFSRILFFLLFFASSGTTILAQCNIETPIPFINSTFGNLTATGNLSGICLLCSASNASNLIDADLTNFGTASITAGVGGSAIYTVTDTDTDYAAGSYVGYRIDTGGVLNVNLLGSITVRTYLNGAVSETVTGNSLVSLGLQNGLSNNYVVGFNTTKSFDAIEISIGSVVGLLNTMKVYYPVIRNYCAGPALACNTPTGMNLPAYPVSIEPSHTSVSGVTVGNILNPENVISSSASDYATINQAVGVASSGSISVKDQLTDYPAGTYAGFEIENSSLLSVGALGNVYITTYLNGAPQDQISGSNLVVNGSLLGNSNRYKVGFVSNKAFDEVQISVRQVAGVSLGATRVYGAFFESFCAGPDLVCNTQTGMVSPTYPVYINGVNTGIDGVACVACSINNPENLIDQNASNFAQINLTASVGNSGSISVKDQITDYPVGSFVGFTIENPSLLNVNALDAVMVRTYLNGVLQETKSGNSALAGVGTNLLVGSSLQTIGFVAAKAFDEARITIMNTASVSLGVVNVYNAVFQKLCPVTLECNKSYTLTNPTFPVIIDSNNTGVSGTACVACAVNNTNNVLTASTTDFATISVTAGVISPVSLAVLDQLSTYPVGTFAGFTIKDLNSLVQLDLFNSLTISTYLDGVLRESKAGSQLLNLSLLGLFGSGSGIYNVGFQATQTFDEIKISVGSLASVIHNINVYGAFINTANTSGGTLYCAVIDAVNDAFPPVVGSAGNVNAGNVLANDTINGNPISISDINLTIPSPATPVKAGAVVPFIDPATGVLVVPQGTPAGHYDITYQICYKLNSLTCDSATVSLDVTAAVIDAVNDSNSTTIYGVTGGNTGINVYANDTLNGSPVNASDVVLTSLPNGPLTVNADGSVTVAPNTPGGTYTVDYTLCEKLNSSNCDTASVTVFVSSPSIALVKVGAVRGTGAVSDLVTYTFTVTNTGNTDLTNVVINDALTNSVNLVVTPSTLAPNATGTATASYAITQADVNTGSVTNSASVTGTNPTGGPVSDISGTTITNDAPTVTTLTPNPGIALVKTGAVGGAGKAGDMITYTFAVTNIGNTTLTNVIINDALTNSVNVSVAPSTLEPNEVGIATATYTLVQADVDKGTVTNTAIATGTTPTGGTISDDSGTAIGNNDPTVTTLTPNPSIALVKTGVIGGTGDVGYPIAYTFTVINTGNTTLSNIVISDPMIGRPSIAVTPSVLAPNEIGTATATYTIQQSDMDLGKKTNSATVTGTPPVGAAVTDISGATILDDLETVTPLIQSPSIVLVKTGAVGGTGKVGDLITYTFTVTNTGNTTLSNVYIDDPKTGSSKLVVSPSILVPNAIGTVTATYAIQQGDIDKGMVTNSATVTGTPPIGADVFDISGQTVSDDLETVTPLTQSPKIALVKTGAVGGVGAVGDLITYGFTVTNIGNTTLSNITVNDPLIGLMNIVITPNVLAPNEIGTGTATYAIQQGDIDKGMVTNSATVTSTSPLISANPVTDISGKTILDNDDTVTPLAQNSSIALVKTGAVGGTGKVGDLITYTFTVTNTGNTTLSNINITDTKTGSSNLAISPSTLSPNAVGTVTATYAIQQGDIDKGMVTNSATVTGTPPIGADVIDISGQTVLDDIETVTPLTQSSKIALVKTGALGGTGKVGDLITYTFTVTNIGNTTLSNINIDDSKIGISTLVVAPSSLGPNEIGTATATYAIQQSDIDKGMVTNSAVVTGTPPIGADVQDISGKTILDDLDTVTPLTQSPKIALVKTGVIGGTGKVGDLITYTFTVTNIGNTTLSNININDSKIGTVNLAVTPSSLLPNEIGTATATYAIQQEDIDKGMVTNSAIVTGTPPIGADVQDISGKTILDDLDTVTPLTQSPKIALVKTGVIGGTGKVGDLITYSFTVTNIGNTTLSNININDSKIGSVQLAVAPSSLLPNEIGTATATYAIQQEDIDKGMVTNSAVVTGTPPIGADVTDISGKTILDDLETVTPLTQSSKIALVKTGAIGGTGNVGDLITYSFTVTNTGNTTLSNVYINDSKIGSVNLAVTPNVLAPNAIGTATATYAIQQGDIDKGMVTNSATVTGTPPVGADVTDVSGKTILDDLATVTQLTQNPKIALVKTGVVGSVEKVGDLITYTFTVTNIGNTTLSNININDSKTGSVNMAVTPSTLAPNEVGIATATYVILQADFDAGKVINSATVTGTVPAPTNGTVTDISGTAITNDNPTVTDLTMISGISITNDGVYVDKNNNGIADVGDEISYTFMLTNTGNVSLGNIEIKDDGVPAVNGGLNSLGRGTSDGTTFSATYAITEADIAYGYVYNSAIASAISASNEVVKAVSTDPTPCAQCPILNNCLTCTITAIPQSPSIAIVKKAVFNDENGDGHAEIGETVSYSFTVMNTGNLPLANVVVTDPLPGVVITGGPISLAVGATDNTSFHGIYHLTVQDLVKGSVSNQATVKGTTPSGAEVVDLSDDEDGLHDNPTVLGIEGCSLEVFNAVSPNGDGLNDFFRVRGIECYPKNSVEIYNRWGVKVYDMDGYNNDTVKFSGISEGRVTVNKSEGLPSGTYFYIVKYEDFNGNGIDKSGYLNISRE